MAWFGPMARGGSRRCSCDGRCAQQAGAEARRGGNGEGRGGSDTGLIKTSEARGEKRGIVGERGACGSSKGKREGAGAVEGEG